MDSKLDRWIDDNEVAGEDIANFEYCIPVHLVEDKLKELDLEINRLKEIIKNGSN